jgi:adenylate cyclase
LGYAYLLLDQTDAAVEVLRKARAANPRAWAPPLFLAAALGLRGDVDEAKAALAEALKLNPECGSLEQLAKSPNWNASPQFVTLREKTVNVGRRNAGVPDK